MKKRKSRKVSKTVKEPRYFWVINNEISTLWYTDDTGRDSIIKIRRDIPDGKEVKKEQMQKA